MTREEMIQMAQETRKHVTNAPVSQELLDAYPAEIILHKVPTSQGPADVYETTNDSVQPGGAVIINLHGGGFIRERTPNDEVFCRKMVNLLHMKVMDVDYRIAPDYPFPAALYESYDCVKWVSDNAEALGVDRSRIILMGHSAGANLCCGLCMLSAERGDFHIVLNAMEYPPLDLVTDPADKPNSGKGIPPERARLYNLYYIDPSEAGNPLASPIYASDEQLSVFPRTMLITAGEDVLCVEGEEFGLKLVRAGVEVTMKRFLGDGHAFTIYRRGNFDGGVQMFVDFVRKNLE